MCFTRFALKNEGKDRGRGEGGKGPVTMNPPESRRLKRVGSLKSTMHSAHIARSPPFYLPLFSIPENQVNMRPSHSFGSGGSESGSRADSTRTFLGQCWGRIPPSLDFNTHFGGGVVFRSPNSRRLFSNNEARTLSTSLPASTAPLK